jgi:hypothetical protein
MQTCYDGGMRETEHERFTLVRRLASIDVSLGRLPFLPGDKGSAMRRRELNSERTEIVARLAGKV